MEFTQKQPLFLCFQKHLLHSLNNCSSVTMESQSIPGEIYSDPYPENIVHQLSCSLDFTLPGGPYYNFQYPTQMPLHQNAFPD